MSGMDVSLGKMCDVLGTCKVGVSLVTYRGMFRFLALLRLCGSHLLIFSTYVFLVSYGFSASSRNCFCFTCLFSILRSFYLLGGVFVVVFVEISILGTLALDLPTLISFAILFLFFSVSQPDHRICISLG